MTFTPSSWAARRRGCRRFSDAVRAASGPPSGGVEPPAGGGGKAAAALGFGGMR